MQWALAGVAGIGVAGVVAAKLLAEGSERQAALLGVGLAAASGGLALWLKRRAVRESLQAALKAVGVMFAVRVVLVAVGVWWVARQGLGPTAFVVGFFGVYFVVQWVEIGFLLAEQKRRGAS
ncbi:MAG: hypothetical protein ACOZIN_04395 [Myxococcota bacterium]